MPTWSSTSDFTRAASELSFQGAIGRRRNAILGSSSGLGSSDQTPVLLTSPPEGQEQHLGPLWEGLRGELWTRDKEMVEFQLEVQTALTITEEQD